MKLTDDDKRILKEYNCLEKDFEQIQKATCKKYTHYEFLGEEISREKAIELLGMGGYLSGIARSAFHYSAIRHTGNGEEVYFDSSRLFKH